MNRDSVLVPSAPCPHCGAKKRDMARSSYGIVHSTLPKDYTPEEVRDVRYVTSWWQCETNATIWYPSTQSEEINSRQSDRCKLAVSEAKLRVANNKLEQATSLVELLMYGVPLRASEASEALKAAEGGLLGRP